MTHRFLVDSIRSVQFPMKSGNFLIRFRWPSITFSIVAINAVIAFITLAFPSAFNYLYSEMPLTTNALADGQWWRFITYMFIHAPAYGVGILHILFNMITLAIFGKGIEYAFGKLQFLIFYILSGVVAGLTLFFELWLRGKFSHAYPQQEPMLIMGASGAIMAIIGAYALLKPHMRIYILFIPYPLKIRTALIGFLILSFILLFLPWLSFIGHSAHIGGALFGLAWTWMWRMWRLRVERASSPFSRLFAALSRK